MRYAPLQVAVIAENAAFYGAANGMITIVRGLAVSDMVTRESYGEVANSGGFIAFATAGFVASMTSRALIHAFVYIPTLNFLRGEHREGVAASLGFTYDI